MSLTEKDVRYVAELAHLELSDLEVQRFLPQLDAILQYVQKLNEVDTTRIEPMAQVTVADAQTATLRPDQIRPSLGRQDALGSAPQQGGGCFKVPKVIERE